MVEPHIADAMQNNTFEHCLKFAPEAALTVKFRFEMLDIRVNDPSAGSPTETLLRLLLPLSDKVH